MITKADLPRLRTLFARSFSGERIVSEKWDEVATKMGSVPTSESIRGLRLILFLIKKVESITVDDVAILGQDKAFQIFLSLERIKSEAGEFLAALKG